MGECSMSVVALKCEHRSSSDKFIFCDDGGIIGHIVESVEVMLEFEVLRWVPTEALSKSLSGIAVQVGGMRTDRLARPCQSHAHAARMQRGIGYTVRYI